MGKKIKITESQLKTLMERKHTYQDTNEEEEVMNDEQTEETEETHEDDSLMNESIKKMKSDFKRFL